MRKNKKYNLDKDPIIGLIVKMTAPVMLAGLLTTSYGFVDMIFASRLGGVQVASVAFVSPLFVMLTAMVRGIARGGVSIIAKLIGQKKNDQAAAYATQLRLLIIAPRPVFSPFQASSLPPFCSGCYNFSGTLFDQSLIYTRIMCFSLPANAVIALYITLFVSQGKTEIATYVSLLSLASNVIMKQYQHLCAESGH